MKNQLTSHSLAGIGFSICGNKFYFICALMFVTFMTGAQDQKIKQAFRDIEHEQPSKARTALDVLASNENDDPTQQYYIGLGFLRTGELDKSLKAFERGIAIKEKYGLNYAGVAHVKMLQQKPNEALPLLARALELSREKDELVLRAVAAAYLADSTDVNKAITLLTKARKLNPNDAETHFLLGNGYLMLNNGGESVNSYEWAAKADPTWAMPYYQIALVYNRSRNENIVLESLNKAISVDPQFAPAYRRLGEIYYLKKEAQKAVDAYEKYLSITENPGDARYQYAFFLIMAKQFDKANQIFEQVVNKPDAPSIALKYYAYSLLEQDTARANAEKARPLLEKYMASIKEEERQASDYAYYGKLLMKLNEDSLANKNFNLSLALDSTQQDILQIQASSLLKNRKFAEAAYAYCRLIRLRDKPSLQDLWYLGQSYYFDEQYVEADTTFNNIMQRLPVEKLPMQVVLFSARSKANIDSTMAEGYAKQMYEALLQKISSNAAKYQDEIIEAYTYLGAFYIHKGGDVAKAKEYYEKILGIDSDNATAIEFMRTLKSETEKGG